MSIWPLKLRMNLWSILVMSLGCLAQASAVGVSSPVPVLRSLGETITLTPTVGITEGASYAWQKDGRNLPTQLASSLSIPAAASANAGRYLFRSTLGSTVVTQEFHVGLFQLQQGTLQVRSDRPVVATARVWGPVQVQWNYDRESPNFRGTRSTTLTIASGDMVSENIIATARVGELTAVCTNYELESIGPPRIVFSDPDITILKKGTPIGVVSIVETYAPSDTMTYQSTGLPPGLSLTPGGVNGHISGTPTTAGYYQVKLSARNSYGVSNVIAWNVTVVDEDQKDFGPAATFASFLDFNGALDPILEKLKMGYIQANVERSGAFSGFIRLGPIRRAFAGVMRTLPQGLLTERTATVSMPGFLGSRPLSLQFTQTSDYGPETAFSAVITYEYNEGVQTMSSTSSAPAMSQINQVSKVVPGRYTFLMDAMSVDVGPSTPFGSGFMTMNINSALQATFIGTLPDGSGITASSPLVSMDGSVPGPIMYLSDRAGDLVYGHLPALTLYFPPVPEVWFAGELTWFREPLAGTRVYPEGFSGGIQLVTEGARYFVPSPGITLLPSIRDATNNARVTFSWGGLQNSSVGNFWEHLVTLTPRHTVIFPAPNPNRLQLDIYSPTGFFTGVLTVNDPNPPRAPIKRQVLFRGMINPELNRGAGFFLLPQLPNPTAVPPVTSANSPILSGKVSITSGKLIRD